MTSNYRKHQFMKLFVAIIRPTECFATGGCFRPLNAVSNNCHIREGRASFTDCESSHSHIWEESRSKEERPAQAIFRQTHTEASRRRHRRLKERERVTNVSFREVSHDRRDWIKFNSAIFACTTDISTI